MITEHVRDHIQTRLVGIISRADMDNLARISLDKSQGKFYVKLGNLDKVYRDRNGSSGDSLVGVIEDGTITTVFLRFRSQGFTWHDGKTIFI